MFRSLLFLFIFISFGKGIIRSQSNSEPRQNGVIFEISKNDLRKVEAALKKVITDVSIRKISQNFDIYLANSASDVNTLYLQFKKYKEVKSLSFDDIVESRSKPNDPRINEQYAHKFIKSFEAWDITTGGKDAKGRDIVIALIDDGFQIDHEDIKANIWVNNAEIAGDGIDNDGNGYKDDINGWNTKTNTGKLDINSHGSYIAGAAAAKGNNGKGISGVNWDAKLMLLVTTTSVSSVIQAYDYVLTQKKLWNTTGGIKGTNIVVTSYSAGIPNGKPQDQPMWCEFYNKLGLEGILNVTATTNSKDNVDVVGDLPSTCPSSFLIVVNSSDELDEMEEITGFGPINVDISAPGESILTTDKTINGYKLESGTSLATPILAGAVALMYSIPCNAIAESADADPSDLSIKVKNAIMSGADQKQSMKGLTVSGGRLNIFNAFLKLQNEFTNCDVVIQPATEFKILNVQSLSKGTFKVVYESPEKSEKEYYLTDTKGSLIFKSKFNSLLTGSFTFETQELPTGVYSLTVVSNKENISYGFGIVNN